VRVKGSQAEILYYIFI